MKLVISISAILLVIMATGPVQAKPEGLLRSGEGVLRYLGIFQVYTAQLYVEEGTKPETVLDRRTSRCLMIHYAVGLSAEDIIHGADKVLARQHGQEQIRPLRHLIDRLHDAYQDISEGDSYDLCYDAVSMTSTLHLNGELAVALTSAELATYYFGIWLGEVDPIDRALRADLLRGLTEAE